MEIQLPTTPVAEEVTLAGLYGELTPPLLSSVVGQFANTDFVISPKSKLFR